MWTSDRKLWKTNDGAIVEDGDPRAHFLYATPGIVLPEEPVVEKALTPAEDKAVRPVENKSRKAK